MAKTSDHDASPRGAGVFATKAEDRTAQTAQGSAATMFAEAEGPALGAAKSKRDRTVVSSPYLHRLQRRHFLLFDILPALGTVAAFALLFVRPLAWLDIGLFLLMWLATGMGITVGFHRLFAHRAFVTTTAMQVVFIVLGSMAGRGPMVSWVAMHRRHHELSDQEGDLHSPNLHDQGRWASVMGFLHAHLTWMIRHDYPNVAHYAPDLMRDQWVVGANRRYYWWVALGLVLPAAIGGLVSMDPMGAVSGFLWGGVVRMFVVEQTTSTINSFLHRFGSRPFRTRDDHSRNLALLSLVTWGESWHNNHHAFPYSAAFGLKWAQLDPGYWLVRILESVGLVWNMRLPTPAAIASQMTAPADSERAA